MISEIRKKLDKKEISVAELCAEYFKRIKSDDTKINSFITLCEEYALKRAEAAQKKINAGEAGILCGIPISVKDNLCTRGIRTTCASRMLSDFVPPYSATAVERIEEDGAVVLGKTNMDEFAMGSMGRNSYFKEVKNPINPSYAPGGSSAGAAASVAAGFCAAALGSDTGGSIRMPAAGCGVVGLNPTYGRVSRYGLIAFASGLDRVGAVSATAEDAGYLLCSIAGADGKDITCTSVHGEEFYNETKKNMSGVRIGIPREFFGDNAAEEIKSACMRAAEFYASHGAVLKEVSLPYTDCAAAVYYVLSSAEAASNLARYDGIKYGHCAKGADSFGELLERSRTEGFGKEVKRRIMLGNYVLSGEYRDKYYKKAAAIRGKIKAGYEEVLGECDFMLSPTVPNFLKPSNGGGAAAEYKNDIFTVSSSLAGLPSLSLPCAVGKNGMPISMSLTGRAFDEKTIIAAGDFFEKERQRI